MPELQLAINPSSHALSAMCVLVTDGRVSYQHEGLSIAHVVPEAFDGGGLAAIRTADWIYLDLQRVSFRSLRKPIASRIQGASAQRTFKSSRPKEANQ